MREYLELEFAPIRYELRGFDYDLEKIIDDWVLMGFLVGNDFIPHLPNLHISEGALPLLYKTYMEILPTLDGYINEGGTLNLRRFEMFMEKLGQQDLDHYEQVRDDIMYLETKRGIKSTRDLQEWKAEGDEISELLEPDVSTPCKDSGLASLLKSADELCLDDDSDDNSDDFMNFKKEYYKEKMEYVDVTPEVMRDQAEGYVRAIQWNLNYYYNGCCSWSWFYPHHYAPYISDIKGFTDLKLEFDMGKPFLPYEQLLGVLPAASKKLLPEAYHGLMTEENSIIIDYYPEKFETDLNGKKQAWEAVVKIPFIDEVSNIKI
uniref:5'-3' exoribonuclease 1-like n=1 Tax=Diabrotica virgifera virgifera TaxID=50390 RepID=A0A6P7H425_DIAVI